MCKDGPLPEYNNEIHGKEKENWQSYCKRKYVCMPKSNKKNLI
jgi:hypothetical protein